MNPITQADVEPHVQAILTVLATVALTVAGALVLDVLRRLA